MPEEMGGRLAWIKSHVREELFGQGQPIRINRELVPEQRWVWYGLRLMAGDSPVPGVICMAEGIPYEEWQIAKQLDVSIEVLKATVDKLMQMGILSVNGNNSLEILNWEHYHGRNKRTEYMTTYMREVYRPRQRAKKQQESRKPNSKRANSKVKNKQANVSHVIRDETRQDKDETRTEEDDNVALSVIEIHEQRFGPIGHPPEALIDTFQRLSRLPIELVERGYKEAAKRSPPPRWPAGWVLTWAEAQVEQVEEPEAWLTEGLDDSD